VQIGQVEHRDAAQPGRLEHVQPLVTQLDQIVLAQRLDHPVDVNRG